MPFPCTHFDQQIESATKLVEETSSLKVQIELLKKELADLGDKSKAKDKEKDKQKEKEKEKVELGDKAFKSLQEKNAELEAEVTRVRGESTAFAEVPTFF
jgi:predicted RNase H-like nuclease (RuvC/YqgF family)